MRKKICVIDGQGGGIGATLIKYIQPRGADQIEVLALGTNAIATAQMMKAGANRGASGENAIVQTSPRVNVITGPLAIIMTHGMMGEVTPGMAEAVCSSDAVKFLLPLTQEKVQLVGVTGEPLPHLVERIVKMIKEMVGHV